MSDHSARPRIESVGTFALIVEQFEVPASACLTYDEGDFTPTWEIIGTGGSGTVTLASDAPATTEETSYCLALLVSNLAYESGPPSNFANVADDGPGVVPEYLKLDGNDCFNPVWRIGEDAGVQGGTANADWIDNDAPHQGENLWADTGVAYKALTSPMPAGTVITYDLLAVGDVFSQAVVVLITNAAPYTGSPKGTNGDGVIPLFWAEGGIVFTAQLQNDRESYDCSFFTGTDGTGPFLDCAGTSVTGTAIEEDFYDTRSDPGDGPFGCVHANTTSRYKVGWFIQTVGPGGGGTYDPGIVENSADCRAAAWAWPAQGYY